MSAWTTETVSACLKPIRLPRVKLQTNAYKTTGTYPIIDQGQAEIAGWTDDDAGLIDPPSPVIVFGDHSRALKYVDYPFVRGADGTQILLPRAGIDPLYFFYALRSLNLGSRGYNRHFTLLKEQTIPVPDLREQTRIAQLLKSIDDAIRLQKQQAVSTEDLKAVVLDHLFTRGLRNEASKDTEVGPMPVSWAPRTVGELCDIWSGGTPRKSIVEYWNGDVPWVSGKDLKLPVITDAIDHVTAKGATAGTRVAPAGSVLLLVRGMGLAKDLPVASITRPMAFNQDVKALVLRDEDYPGRFLRSAMYVGKERLLSQIVDSAHGTKTLNLSDVESFILSWPSDPAEAVQIARIIDMLEAKIALHHRRSHVLEELIVRLMGSITAREVEVDDIVLPNISGSMQGAAA